MSASRSSGLALEQEVQHLCERIGALGRAGNEELLASLFIHAPFGASVISGRQLRYRLVNPAYQAMVGPEIPLIGRPYREVFPDAARAGAETRLLRVIDTGEPWIIREFKAPVPGKPHAMWSGQVVRLPASTDGEPLLLSIIWDLTDQAATEQALRESEARFRALVTATSDAVYRMNADATSMTYLHGHGMVPDTETPDTNWLEKYVYADDQPHVMAAAAEAIRTKSPFNLEHRVLLADGSVGWWSTRGVPIRNAQGEILEWFGAASNITERKQAEDKIRQQNKIMEAVNRILSNAFLSDSEEDLGRQCLAIVKEATESKMGFIGEINAAGRLDDIAISEPGWEACRMDDSTGQRRPPLGFIIHGIYGRVLLDGKGFFTNDPASHPDSIGTPEGHPPLKAFLGVPMKQDGRTIGMIAVGNREGGYRQQDLECLEALSTAVAHVVMRSRAELFLRKSEEEFRVLAQNLVSAVALIDRHGNFRIVNKSFLRMFDLDDDSSILNINSRDWSQWRVFDENGSLLDVDEHPVRKAALTRTAVRNELVAVQSPHRTDLKWLLVSAEPILDAHGNLQHFICTYYDLTQRKQTQEALEESRAKLEAALESATDAVFISDAEGRFINFNEAFATFHKFRTKAECARTLAEYPAFLDLFLPDGKLAPLEMWPVPRALRGETVTNAEYSLRRKDTGETWAGSYSFAPIRDRDGVIVGSVVFGRDITNRKRVEQEIEQQSKAKDKFLAMLGHELRNPLAAIDGAIQLLPGATAEQRSHLDELMAREVQVLRRLVDDLLDLSRVERGRIVLQKEPIDLSELLEAQAMVFRSTIAGRGQQFVLRLPSQEVGFLADKVRLEQVVTNLLDNASKYTGRGTRIELSGAAEDSLVVIRCRDDGPGIPQAIRGKIFEAFTRGETHGANAEPGLGIGLPLVKGLVELHGGTVSVESGDGGTGSEFTVRFPWLKADAQLAPAKILAAVARSRSALSIAIVEDNPDVAMTRALSLEQAGHQVAVFTNAASALAGIPPLKPAAVLIDIGLPDMDGYELAAELRRKKGFRRTLLIAISGFKRRPRTEKSRDHFDFYFVKPVKLAELAGALDACEPCGTARIRGTRKRSKPLQLLLVEDHVGYAEVTADMARRQGFEVRIASSGSEALEAAPAFRPDLALCDLILPDMSGRDVVRGLRTNPATQHARAVIITAMPEEEIREFNRAARESGSDELYLSKLDPDALRGLLAELKAGAPRYAKVR